MVKMNITADDGAWELTPLQARVGHELLSQDLIDYIRMARVGRPIGDLPQLSELRVVVLLEQRWLSSGLDVPAFVEALCERSIFERQGEHLAPGPALDAWAQALEEASGLARAALAHARLHDALARMESGIGAYPWWLTKGSEAALAWARGATEVLAEIAQTPWLHDVASHDRERLRCSVLYLIGALEHRPETALVEQAKADVKLSIARLRIIAGAQACQRSGLAALVPW